MLVSLRNLDHAEMMCTKGNYFLGFLTVLFVAFPLRLEVDIDGALRVAMASAVAKSGSGSDGDGGNGDGDDGDDGDGDDGDSDGDDGDGNDSDDDDGDHDDDDHDDQDHDDDDRSHSSKRDVQKAGSKQIRRVERLQNGARVTFADGSMAEILGDRFRRTDASGREVERRRATGSDVSRLRAHFEGMQPEPKIKPPKVEAPAVRAYYRGRDVEIHYANGWTEKVTRGRYVLTDQFGRIVASRKATQKDVKRLSRFRD